MSILAALRGVGGEFELQRLLGGLGTVTYIATGPALVWAGKITVSFDTFCLTYPTGLAACLGATAGAIALKDRNVAVARQAQAEPPLGDKGPNKEGAH